MDVFTEKLLTRETIGCLQPLTTGKVLKICGFFQSGSVIVFSILEIILLSTIKQTSEVLNILRVVLV